MTKPGDPFQFVVKEHLPASAPAMAHVADPDGAPMARIRRPVQGAGHARGTRRFPIRGQTSGSRPRRSFTGSSASHARRRQSSRSRASTGPSWSRTSSSPRPRPAKGRRAVPLRRQGRVRPRSSTGRSTARKASRSRCPESDLTVTLRRGAPSFRTEHRRARPGCWETIPISDRRVQDPAGKGEPSHAHGAGQLADGPQRHPLAGRVDEARPGRRWRRSITSSPPVLDPKANGRFGQIEVLAGPGRRALLPRLRPGQGGHAASSAPPGRWRKDKPIVAFGGNAQHADDDHVSSRTSTCPRASRRRSTSRSCCPRARWATASPPAGPR